MKYFASALLAGAINARGTSGGINQGYENASKGASHGFGYNVGNDYMHGDSHGHYMKHNDATTHEMGYSYDAGHVDDPIDHIYGYDMIPRITTTEWEQFGGFTGTTLNADGPQAFNGGTAGTIVRTEDARMAYINTQVKIITGELALAVADRTDYITDVLARRRERLEEIHADNSVKIVAPFELQIDLLEEEIDDVKKAMEHATADMTEAKEDLISRMNDYLEDRQDAMDIEMSKVIRLVERAVDEGKSVPDVVYGMKLDWLAGVFFQGGDNIIYDDSIFDDHVYDGEFDMFSFDIGHGKGHGHTTHQGAGNSHEIGMVVGRDGSSEIEMRGEPVARDGTRRRYDQRTQNGHGSRGQPSNYAVGHGHDEADGAHGYNQAADMGVQQTRSSRPSRGGRRQAPKRGGRPTGRRAPSGKQAPRQRRPSQRRPAQKRPS